MKIKWLAFALIVGCSLSSGCVKKEGRLSTAKHALMNRLVSAPDGAVVGIAFESLSTGDTIFINENEQMHAASTMKVPVMIELFKQAAEGRFSLDDSLTVYNSFRSIVDGSPYSLDIEEDSDDSAYKLIGRKSTYRDLLYLMITRSGNLATNILIDTVGAKNVMETLSVIGATGMNVLRGVEDIKAYELGMNNTTSALALMKVMKAIATDAVVSPEACVAMREILSDQEHRKKIPALLPENVRVANKTGSITKIDHDAAIVFPPNGKNYVLAIITKGIENHEEAQRLIADLSKIIYDHLAGG